MELKHVVRSLDGLVLPESNPRIIRDKRFEVLKESIKTDPDFLAARPIIVSMAQGRENTVVAGNMRVRACVALGHTEVPVVEVYGLSQEEERRWGLKDNLHQGEFDWDKLAKEFELDFLEAVGFDDKELNRIVGLKDTGEDDEFDADEEAKNIGTPTSKPGDVFQLGRHRLMCGDSTKKEDVQKLMGGSKAKMVFTDPPYNVNYSGRGKETSRKIENDNMDSQTFRNFLEAAFEQMKTFTTEDVSAYICYASRTHREFEDSLNKVGFEVRNQIIWVKLVASMGWGDYRWKHEPILYCHKTGQSTDFYGDRSQYTEWKEQRTDEELLKMIKKNLEQEEKGGSTVWRLKRDMNYKHPTQKPIQLIETALRNSSKKGDFVLDLFGGGGSTLIACENYERTSFLMEYDPTFVDVIIKRWEEKTGEKVIKLA